MFIVFISKFFALFPIILDDILRVFRFFGQFFIDDPNRSSYFNVSRLKFLKKPHCLLDLLF